MIEVGNQEGLNQTSDSEEKEELWRQTPQGCKVTVTFWGPTDLENEN